MATDLAKLVVSLEAQTAKYQRELEKANRKLDRFARAQNKAIKFISGAFRQLGVAIAAIGFGAVVKQAINTADQFSKLNDRLGISVESITELTFAAERAGVSQQQLALGLQRAQRRVAEAAKGTGEAVNALKELGLEAAVLTKLPLDEQFSQIAQKLSQVANEADRTRLAMKLFDSEGVALLQLTKDGAAGIEILRRKARELGFTMSKEGAQGLVDAKDSMTDLKAATDALVLTLVSRLAPALKFIAEQATKGLRLDSAKEAAEDLKQQIDLAVQQRDALAPQAPERAIFEERIANLVNMLELTQSRVNIEKKATEELKLQTVLLDEMGKITRKERGSTRLTDFLGGLSIESGGDAILRPENKEDIERKNRTTEEFFDTLIEKAEEAQEKTKKLNDEAASLGLTFASAFEDAIVEGKKLSDVLKGLLQDIIRIAARKFITEPLGNFFGGLFGGGKAAGGPVSGGTSYLVGEKGPELFTPGVSGHITPNGAMGGANISYAIDARGADEAAVISKMIPLLERTVELSKNEIRTLIKRGRFV